MSTVNADQHVVLRRDHGPDSAIVMTTCRRLDSGQRIPDVATGVLPAAWCRADVQVGPRGAQRRRLPARSPATINHCVRMGVGWESDVQRFDSTDLCESIALPRG